MKVCSDRRNNYTRTSFALQAHEVATAILKPLAAAFAEAAGSAAALVGELINLQTALVNQNAAIAEAFQASSADGSDHARSFPDVPEHGESQAQLAPLLQFLLRASPLHLRPLSLLRDLWPPHECRTAMGMFIPFRSRLCGDDR